MIACARTTLSCRNQIWNLSVRYPRKRTFFASSTDHSTLLKTAEIHKLEQSGSDSIMYVLAAEGMEPDIVRKVSHLHLARICREKHRIFGAKVVNRTLGTATQVCDRLLTAALGDVGQNATAVSTLHGLSEWVERGLSGDDSGSIEQMLSSFKTDERTAIQTIARNGNESPEGVFQNGSGAWETLAREFVRQGLGEEASLYQSQGGVLVEIEQRADTSEYSDSSGGAMAVFTFS